PADAARATAEWLTLSSPSPRTCGDRVGVRGFSPHWDSWRVPLTRIASAMRSDLSPQAGPGEEKWLALVHAADTPAIFQPVDPCQRQRIDHKAQCAVGGEIEGDGEHGADGAGMHDQHHIASG